MVASSQYLHLPAARWPRRQHCAEERIRLRLPSRHWRCNQAEPQRTLPALTEKSSNANNNKKGEENIRRPNKIHPPPPRVLLHGYWYSHTLANRIILAIISAQVYRQILAITKTPGQWTTQPNFSWQGQIGYWVVHSPVNAQTFFLKKISQQLTLLFPSPPPPFCAQAHWLQCGNFEHDHGHFTVAYGKMQRGQLAV